MSHASNKPSRSRAKTGTVLGRSKPDLKLVLHAWIGSGGDHVATDTEMEVPTKKFSQRSGWWEAELARQVYGLDGAYHAN